MQLRLLLFCFRSPKGFQKLFLGSSLVPGVQILERGMKCCFFLFTFLCIIPTIWRLEQASQIWVTVIQFTIHLQSAVCKCHTLPLGQGSVVTIKQHPVDIRVCKFYWWVESVWLLLHKFWSHFGIFGVKYHNEKSHFQTFQHAVLACIHYRERYTK